MSDVNPSIAAVTEEIRVREQELEALRAALTVLQSDRQPLVQILTGRDGQFAVNHVFQNNGDDRSVIVMPDTVAPADVPSRKALGLSSRESTARLLGYFDRQNPRSLEEVATRAGVSTRHIAIGVLMRHGYLKKKGSGYVRTAKVYEP
jgi:hypothetical protein